jgi:hypothetical protein
MRRSLVFCALLLSQAMLQAQPKLSREELEALYTAAGFPIQGGQPVNRCKQAARPRVAFVDLNGDQRPEALFVDASPSCYAPEGRYYAVLGQLGGAWQLLLSGDTQIKAQPQRGPAGWFDLKEQGQGGERLYRFEGQRYQPLIAESPLATPAADVGAGLSPADEAAAFKTAGFKRKGQRWVTEGCDDPSSSTYAPGSVAEVRDLNGDGRPEVLLSEGGTFCYGNTGQGFWLLSQAADGAWKLMINSVGMPDFMKTKGQGGYPDIQIGGPGLCFPVARWNGRDYKTQRWEYEGKPCKRPG